jgi:hypothetical protein
MSAGDLVPERAYRAQTRWRVTLDHNMDEATRRATARGSATERATTWKRKLSTITSASACLPSASGSGMSATRVGELVDAIVQDLTDRRGLAAAWGELEPDVREHVRQQWIRIVQAHQGVLD